MGLFDFLIGKSNKGNSVKANDVYNVLNKAGQREITLEKICNIIGIDVPEKFIDIKDEIHNNVTMRGKHITEGSYVFRIVDAEVDGYSINEWAKIATDKGAKILFIDKERYEKENADDDKYPFIPVENVLEKAGKLFSYIKDLNNVKTVAVTGTCGKTTTMQFLKKIVLPERNGFMNSGNLNSYESVANHIMTKVTPEHEVYIQETGASSINSVRKSAAMLAPDAAIVLNVFNHHINHYKSYENILRDKTSYDDYLKDNGVIITNYDDEGLAGCDFKHKVLSFGIHTEEDVDYRAVNIAQNNQYLEFDVLYRGNTAHIKIDILGEHNVYNALAAFALADWLGIPKEKIAKGFLKYSSSGIRQNYKEIGGYKLLVDCYNLCEDSLKADVDAIRGFNLAEGQKKIAIITGENKLGDQTEAITNSVGKTLNTEGIDHIIVVGIKDETPKNLNYYCHGRALYEGILSQGYKNVTYVTDPAEMEEAIKRISNLGDLLLFKGVLYLDLAPVIDRVFGTGFSMDYDYYISRGKTVENEDFVARKIEVLEALDIVDDKNKELKDVVIPDEIDGYKVHRIAKRLFKGRKNIQSVDLGNSVVNIGVQAFRGCENLEKIVIPDSVRVIEDNAFRDCKKLKQVIIGKGVTHIGKYAFKGCSNLHDVQINHTIENISDNAFEKHSLKGSN